MEALAQLAMEENSSKVLLDCVDSFPHYDDYSVRVIPIIMRKFEDSTRDEDNIGCRLIDSFYNLIVHNFVSWIERARIYHRHKF